ncbi:MAG: ORF6N domain-containing protein [Paludibacteraceae bacterium]|nr:ORF6N domain-containing protein [Paludibacteraceae bacterium]
MAQLVKYEQVKDKIVLLRGKQVILDSDVALLYGVETKRVNEAVKNNPDKFPEGYLFVLDNQEVINLKSKISTASWGGRRNAPTAFTESGLYMLATILKSERATQTTIAIIDTFVQLRELAHTMQEVAVTEDAAQKKNLMQRSGELIGEVLGSQLDTTETETEIELNFAIVKIKHKVKKGKNNKNKSNNQ